MKAILVTGGAGFISSHLVEELSQDPAYKVVALDNLLTGDNYYLPQRPNVIFVEGDANNPEDLKKLFAEYNFEFVFHYAAIVGVKRTLDHPLMVLEDIEGFKHLFNLCQENKVKRVFFSSSSEVYGESPEFPQHEEFTPLNSRLPYAIVKNVGEAFLKSYNKEFGTDYTIFRFFNTYGPRQSTDFVMSKFIDAALSDKDITIYGDGSQTRTFCFVRDNIEATTRTLKEGLIINDVVNVGSNIEISIRELAETIIRLADSESKLVYLPPLKEGDMPRRLPVVDKMKKLLGRDFTSLEDGIKMVLEYNTSHGKNK